MRGSLFWIVAGVPFADCLPTHKPAESLRKLAISVSVQALLQSARATLLLARNPSASGLL